MNYFPIKLREDDYDLITKLADTMDVDEADALHELIKFYVDCRKALADEFNRRASIEFVED